MASAMIFLPGLINAVTISNSQMKVIGVTPDSNTGLNDIFVVYNTSGCIFTYDKASNGYTVDVKRYNEVSGRFDLDVQGLEPEATKVSFPLTGEDAGYMVQDGTTVYYCWIVNYANHTMTLGSIAAAEQQDCGSTLLIHGEAAPIGYYTRYGMARNLSREILIEYTTQEFDEGTQSFLEVPAKESIESWTGSAYTYTLGIPAYCSTIFSITGDRFQREWNIDIMKESEVVTPVAVDCRTEAIQEESISDDEASNVMGGETNGLGGSAPADISFYAYTTEGVLHYEWQMSHSQNFEVPDYRFYQRDLDYTFTEEGTFYLRFIGSNADGTCETIGDTYTVTIGASALEIPNAFSPNGDGVNDIWKVSYRSLIEFHCEIFNRNGQRIYGFDDPSDGWDGTWHGKTVKPGVYYYVITAIGADGQKYKRGGDINILNATYYSPSSGTPSE